jgi:hypothetical protein
MKKTMLLILGLLILLRLIIFVSDVFGGDTVFIPAELIEVKKNIATVKILSRGPGGAYGKTFKVDINTLFGTDLSKRPRKRAMSKFNSSYPNEARRYSAGKIIYPKLPNVVVKMNSKGDSIQLQEYYSGGISWIYNSRDGKIFREMARALVAVKADYTNWLRKRSRYFKAKNRKKGCGSTRHDDVVRQKQEEKRRRR